MFINCRSLTSLNISMFDTKKLVNAESAFEYCMSLTSLDLSSFDFSSPAVTNSMFLNCSSLKYLALPNYMPLINDAKEMFKNCLQLNSLNLSFLQSATKLKSV